VANYLQVRQPGFALLHRIIYRRIPNINIFCNLSLQSTHKFETNNEPAPGYLFDNRYYTTTHPEQGMWIETQSCALDANMNAYTYSCPQSLYPWTMGEDVSVFCHMSLWTGLRLAGQSLTSNRANVYAPGSINTDLFSFFMPRCIIHEMTHSPSIMGGTAFMLGSSTGSPPLVGYTLLTLMEYKVDRCQNGVKAYQYACVISLAVQDSSLAVTNSGMLS
jgi:hypothetical protein